MRMHASNELLFDDSTQMLVIMMMFETALRKGMRTNGFTYVDVIELRIPIH